MPRGLFVNVCILIVVELADSTTTTPALRTSPSTETQVLFQSRGTISSYRNEWLGWYISGNTVDTGEGKRDAYDSFSLTGLRFEDDDGSFIQYELNVPYRGKTLLKIVQGCLGENPQLRRQPGSPIWNKGVCHDVGFIDGYAGVGWSVDVDVKPENLRIGVGGASSSDLNDYVLFMPVTGNGQGSFKKQKVWAFGADGRVNFGHDSTVKIIGIKRASDGTSDPCLKWCGVNEKDWSLKCTWSGCSGCEICDTISTQERRTRPRPTPMHTTPPIPKRHYVAFVGPSATQQTAMDTWQNDLTCPPVVTRHISAGSDEAKFSVKVVGTVVHVIREDQPQGWDLDLRVTCTSAGCPTRIVDDKLYCASCAAGYYGPDERLECKQCPPGRHSSHQGFHECLACPKGRTTSREYGTVNCYDPNDTTSTPKQGSRYLLPFLDDSVSSIVIFIAAIGLTLLCLSITTVITFCIMRRKSKPERQPSRSSSLAHPMPRYDDDNNVVNNDWISGEFVHS